MKFSLSDFDPVIVPIPSSCLYPQDLLVVKHDTAMCPTPQSLALAPSITECDTANTETTATISTQLSESELSANPEVLTADKDFFMALACLAARRSKDPHRQVNIHSLHACSHQSNNVNIILLSLLLNYINFAGGILYCQWGRTSCRCWL